MSRTALLLPSILLLTALAGCSEEPPEEEPLPWHGRDLSADGWQSVEIAPSWSFETDFRLSRGQTLTWDWTLEDPGSITYQLHTHDDGAVRVIAGPEAAANGRDSYTAPSAGEYSLVWENGATAQTLWFQVTPDPVLAASYPPE